MSLLLTALLTLPAATPTTPFDGNWTIMSVDHDGKKTQTYTSTTIHDGRLILKGSNREAPITIELEKNHQAELWAGSTKMVYVPADEIWHYDDFLDGGYGPPRKEIITPAHWESRAQHGFYLEDGDLLNVYFVSKGPTLTLTLRRGDASAHATVNTLSKTAKK